MKQAEIAHLLPAVFQRTLGAQPDVLGALLGVMEDLHAPAEKILAELDRYFLPESTDDAYLLFLAHWLDLDWLVAAGSRGRAGPECLIDITRLRRLVMCAVSLYRQRGTRAALVQFLTIATGDHGFNIREDPGRPFHVQVEYPNGADLELVRRIVEWEKPAYVTYELCCQAQEQPAGKGGSR